MITIIVHMSAGNESVGSMWHETFEFEETATLKEVIEKIRGNNGLKEDIIIPVKKDI